MEKENERKSTAVLIPTPLFKEIEERIKGADFAFIFNYVAYVLRESIADQPNEELFTREDRERAKERLKRLGCL